MYDRVVGHSYVPDMVDGIAKHMARLDAEMVKPVKKGTEMVAEAFKDLIGEVQPILDRLFPDASALRKYRSEEHTSELQSLMRISYAVFCLTQTNVVSTH